MQRVRTPFVLSTLIALACTATSAAEPDLVAKVEAFRAAREAGDLDRARAFLADDPRVWYDAREGDGNPWSLAGGRWKAWDAHFNGHSDPGEWHVEGDRVWAVAEETNDYFRALERQDTPRYRITYFFDDGGKIQGYMISAADPGTAVKPRQDRFEEFAAWARVNHPEEWDYLRPGGELDPTGDRAPRTRLLLDEWRREVGLPPLDGDRNAHGVFTGELKSVLYVADVEKSAEFFEQVLGFDFDGFAELSGGRRYYADMVAGGTRFGLHEPTAAGQEARVGRQRLYFRVRDVQAHRRRVLARGAEAGAIRRTGWMDMFIVHDPDGHEIVFAETDPARHTTDPW